ncbi:MAG: hypothetical protein ACI9OJ_005618, partial [Myxococcota bacterium]
MKTLVIQPSAESVCPGWMRTCLDSVQYWALGMGYAYDSVGPELARGLPDWFREQTRDDPKAASALGRLIVMRNHLNA